MKKTAETLVAYLRRVGNDQIDSGKDYTGEDYHRAANRVEKLESVIRGFVDAFGLDDLSGFTPEQQRAIRNARRVRA